MADLMDFVQEVKRSNDIVSVIASYIDVKQRGQNFWARCPFHGEKTPSFCINPHQQYYKCFGCQESGDVIKFVQQYESCTFMEALEILAKRANLKMPEFGRQKTDAKLAEKKKKRDIYLDILRDTARFYWKCLYSDSGLVARQYMQNRGFATDTMKTFGIGYSSDMYSLPNYLASKGYHEQDYIAAGVVQQSATGKKFDALCERLIVPVFDISGRVIAFGGRALTQQRAQYGKYKNTAETEIFSKKNNLYAINFAKQQKQQGNLPYIIMVEGYMDVIAMYQAGVCNCVASMGTSLTEQQAKLLSRLTDTVYICYDGDAAGQHATIRGMDILANQGLEVRVMSIPDNQDPDEYIKAHGKDAFVALIEQALPLVDYKLSVLQKYYNIDNVEGAQRNNALAKFVKGAVKVLDDIDELSQGQYVKAISLKTGYSEEYLRRALNKATVTTDSNEASADTSQQQQVEQELSSEDKAMYFVAACVLNGLSFADIKHKPQCSNKFLAKVYDYVFDCKDKGTRPTMDMIYSVAPDADKQEYQRITDYVFEPSNAATDKKYFDECCSMLERARLRMQREHLTAQLKDSSLSEQQFSEIAHNIEQINKQIEELK